MKALFMEFENLVVSGKYIFVAKDKIESRNFNELKNDFKFAFKRLELFK